MLRRLGVLAAVLTALCAAAAWIFWRSAPPRQSQPLAGIKESEISTIQVHGPGGAFTLQNKLGAWALSSPISDRADASACAELVKDMAGMTVGSEVAHDPSSYPQYEIDAASATRIALFKKGGKEPIFDADFGKTALGFNSIYLRWSDQKPVYLANGISRYAIAKAANDYRDRSIFTITQDQASAIRIQAGGRVYEIERSSAAWIFTKPKSPKFKAAKAAAVVTDIYSLRIPDFPPASASTAAMGFGKPAIVLTISAPGQSNRCLVGKKRISKNHQTPYYYYARLSGRTAPVFLAAYDIDPLLRALKF